MHIQRIVLSVWLVVVCILLPANADSDPLAAVEKARLSGDKKLEMELLEPLVFGTQRRNPRAHIYYAALLRDQRRFEEAREHCKTAMELAPRDHQEWQTARSMFNDLREPAPITNSVTKGGRIGYVGIMFHNQKVLHIVPGSPAEKANILLGDLIVSYNGKPAKGKSDEVLGKEMRGLEGTVLDLIIERAGKKYSCSIRRGKAVQQEYFGPTEIKPMEPPLGGK